MPIQSAFAEDMFPIVRDLAKERSLVCFDPQKSTVYQPGGASVPNGSLTLELADGSTVGGPAQVLVEDSIRGLSESN